MAYIAEGGQGVLDSGFQDPGTVLFTATRTIAVGETCFLFAYQNNGTPGWASVSDESGNTWVLDVSLAGFALFRSHITIQIDSGDDVIVTASGATAWGGEVVLDCYNDTFAGSPFDQSATLDSSFTAATASIGPTGTTTQADELIITGARSAAATVTGFSAAGASSGASFLVSMFYKVVSATGTQSASWVRGADGSLNGVVATYKLGSPAGVKSGAGIVGP